MSTMTAVPLRTVGAVELGAPREQVRTSVGTPCEEFLKTPDSVTTTDDFGAFHVFYNEHGRAEAVEVFDGTVEVNGVSVLQEPVERLREAVPSVVVDEYGAISVEESVGATVEDGYVVAILFGGPGYYEG